MTEQERFAQQIVIATPFEEVNNRRVKDGLSVEVCIDPCILNEIKMLWSTGIITHGCCCGHNNPEWFPFVNVGDESIQKMLDMGYIQQHFDKDRKDTFRLKSVN